MNRKTAIMILEHFVENYDKNDPLEANPIDDAILMGIRSLKADEKYQLEYEKAEEVECVNLEEAIEAIKHAPINFSIESDIDFSKYQKEIQLIICNILSAQEVAIRKLDKIAVKVGKRCPNRRWTTRR